MNFWKQTTHIMSYFKEENFRGDKRLPNNFMTGFLEVSLPSDIPLGIRYIYTAAAQIRTDHMHSPPGS